ncbi:MAG: hypothetical protein V3R99_01875, partial [Thermoguttaceae bacterium]
MNTDKKRSEKGEKWENGKRVSDFFPFFPPSLFPDYFVARVSSGRDSTIRFELLPIRVHPCSSVVPISFRFPAITIRRLDRLPSYYRIDPRG